MKTQKIEVELFDMIKKMRETIDARLETINQLSAKNREEMLRFWNLLKDAYPEIFKNETKETPVFINYEAGTLFCHEHKLEAAQDGFEKFKSTLVDVQNYEIASKVRELELMIYPERRTKI